jgi:hypothetical protein
MKRSNELMKWLLKGATQLKEIAYSCKTRDSTFLFQLESGLVVERILEEFQFLWTSFKKFGIHLISNEIVHLRIEYLFQIIVSFCDVSVMHYFPCSWLPVI